MGEGCGHLEEDMCMYLNDNAITYSKSGAHRLIKARRKPMRSSAALRTMALSTR